jgi:hypothetical protein
MNSAYTYVLYGLAGWGFGNILYLSAGFLRIFREAWRESRMRKVLFHRSKE